MPYGDLSPVFAFVWRPREISRQVVEMACHTTTRAIFDTSHIQRGQNASIIKAAGINAAGVADVKVSLNDFMDPTLDRILEEAGIETLWVEYHPGLTTYPVDVFLERLHKLELKWRCVPIIGNVDTLIHIFNSDWLPKAVAIKGAEAAGFVSTETTGILFSILRQIMKKQDRPPRLIVWGGIALPEAAAAFLCSGAAGIVFESLHWLTDMVQMDEPIRQRIARLRPEHTTLIGQPLGVPCRVFDKGNSLAVKGVKQYTGSFLAGDITPQDRLAFFRQVSEKSIQALESDFGSNALIPLGPEAAFAGSFAEHFGRSTGQALRAFIREIERLCKEAPQKKRHFLDSPTAKRLGTIFPFVQGAMSCISDVPAFALSVAEAGGLPTVALGLKNKEQIEQDLSTLKKVMGDRVYAVNIITLSENPFREEQLAWLEETLPPFVVIAAGDPSYAERLRRQNIEVIYIAPDEGLVRMALDAGVRYVVLEGNEAGGHVGEHTTLTLAQIMLNLKRREPGLFKDMHIILAGGIFDQETAFRAAMLGSDAIQMGTAYLATEEIVASGALSPLYQRMILKSPPGTTVISGESIGLRVRSIKTPKIEAICALEREWAALRGDEASFRRRLETLSAGSLLVAARGIAQPAGQPVDPETCIKEGQFMSGASAGCISHVCTVAELHREIAEGDFEPAVPDLASSPSRAVVRTTGSESNGNRVAVTGMAVVNAMGNSPQEIWDMSLTMKSGIMEIPSSRWDHSLFYDPDPMAPGKTYCKVGAFRNIEISRKELGISPQDFRTMSGSTRLTMWLAHQVVADSGILRSNIPRERIGVLISQNSGEVASTVKDICVQREVHHILQAVRNVIPMTPEVELAVAQEIMSGRVAIDDTTLLGRLNCTAGGFICNKYGFMGPCYSVTAACATSLAALYSAIHMIKNGVIDAAIVGGGEELLDPAHYLEFSAIGALSGLSGIERPPHESSRPFDATRDGMVMGEGGAMIVIERESVAKNRGATIHAYITGIGASNSHRGMVESLAETQEIAFRAAFEDAGYGPDQVDLVECHATSTAQGDLEEVKALKRFFPSDKPTILTSFKSQIGHTLGASGLNNLIRGILAMKAGVYPATLNFRAPDPRMGIENRGFIIPTQPSKWAQPPDRPRRVMVNAFGFGGANYVVHLEEIRDTSGAVLVSLPFMDQSAEKVCPFREGLADMEGVCMMDANIAGRPYRLGVLAADEKEARIKVGVLEPIRESKALSSKELRAMARQGVFAAPSGETPPALAFVFSGQGSQYSGMGREIYNRFPLIREWMDRMAAIADFELLNTIFHSSEEHIQKTRWQQPALFTLEYAIARYFMSQGVSPLAVAGHSVGELTALCISGVYSWEDGFRLVNKRAQCMDKAGSLSTDPGAMIAVDAPMEVLEKKVTVCENVFFTNFNSPQQIVLGGGTEEILNFMKELKKEGHRATRLKVSMAFHSPVMRVIRDELEEFIADMEFHPPRIPVISNTTMKPFPNDPEKIGMIVAAHLESPVHWMQNVKTLWNDYGVRFFLEVGPKNTLCNLISDTIDQAQCAQTFMPGKEVETLHAGKARLFSLGLLKPDITPVQVASLPTLNLPPRPVRSKRQDASSENDPLEEIIGIIMDSTGYERDEIEPDMDIRQDLAIRSSRLPVIMDAAERRFGITINLEDFVGVHTVRDMADRISQVMARSGVTAPVVYPAGGTTLGPAVETPKKPSGKEKSSERGPLRRLVLNETPFEHSVVSRLELRPGHGVAVMSLGRESSLAAELADLFNREFKMRPLRMDILDRDEGEKGFDLRTPEGAEKAASHLASIPSLAGLVLVMDNKARSPLGGMQEAAALLTGFFSSLKGLMRSPAKAFCVLFYRKPADTWSSVAAEGILGMFLAAAQEYTSVLFRSVALDRDTDIKNALDQALDTGTGFVQMLYHGEKPLTLQAVNQPVVIGDKPAFTMGPGDLVVISGGGRGITAYLARALAPFQPRLVLLGRTVLDPSLDYESLHGSTGSTEGAIRRLITKRTPDMTGDKLEKEVQQLKAGVEITRALRDLTKHGLTAEYYACDVSDPAAVEEVMTKVVKRFGRIDGIIHGAGLLKDAFMEFMTPEDFSKVTDVKLLGAWNLYQASRAHGLRFFVGISSIVAVTGNAGQVNYCAASRALAAMVGTVGGDQGLLPAKALMLPPIEGAGMADDPEIRELMKLRNMESAYIHVSELADLFCRELFLSPADQSWVIPARSLPGIKTVKMDVTDPESGEGDLSSAGLVFKRNDLPMIQRVNRLDLEMGKLEAHRIFSHEHDLWLKDHRPFKLLKHPLVSGIMAIEAFLEAAHLLYPHLNVLGVKGVAYKDILECPLGQDREAQVACSHLETSSGKWICRLSLSSRDISPSGRSLDTWSENYQGQVILGSQRGLLRDRQDLAIHTGELNTRPVGHDEVLKWYNMVTALQGRYQVIEKIDGTGPGVIKGSMVYREMNDFAGLDRVRYQYPPYLLEALMQMVSLYVFIKNKDEKRTLIPAGIGEMGFSRISISGERFALMARLKSEDEGGLGWDCCAKDENGVIVMQVSNLEMRWFA